MEGEVLSLRGGVMEHRVLGRTGRRVSVVGLGTWQLGSDWGSVRPEEGLAVLRASADAGVTFFDTADAYGDGRSERLIGEFLRECNVTDPPITVATKMGRLLEQVPENYVMDHFRSWTDSSRSNLGVERLDLVQLHCPPAAVYDDDAVFDALDTLVEEGVMASYGVSVETVDEALAAIRRPNVATVQIVLNAFRLKPFEEVLPAAEEAGVGIIARVPLASGLLSGRYTRETRFGPDDHRTYNVTGEAFDVGETFSGVDFRTGLVAAREFSALVAAEAPVGVTPAQAAIAWIWQHPAVSTVIPGARNVGQARANAAAGGLAPLGASLDEGVRRIYDTYLRETIHPRW
jgi:aryl-alcohol dehydrogenase-like predicted oxidoreductase